jgi:hypothetical protein
MYLLIACFVHFDGAFFVWESPIPTVSTSAIDIFYKREGKEALLFSRLNWLKKLSEPATNAFWRAFHHEGKISSGW